MDSKLDPVYRALFRHAEHSGDRQDVRREDETNDHNSRRDRRETADRPDPWQDDTSVSISALRVLLLNLLGADIPAPPSPHTPARSTGAMAQAAGAYRTTAAHTAPPAPSTTTMSSSGHPAPGLSPDDIRAIGSLIVDLDRLTVRGIDILRIEKNGTFLQSLATAARRALDNP